MRTGDSSDATGRNVEVDYIGNSRRASSSCETLETEVPDDETSSLVSSHMVVYNNHLLFGASICFEYERSRYEVRKPVYVDSH
jgi:hypothetical protein